MPENSFFATLTPHRSLGPRGFFILMALISSISFIAGVIFFAVGAWPVVGFFGLDVLLIYGAFKLNYHAGMQHEIIKINGEQLEITRVSPSGRSKKWHFNRYWVRVEHFLDPEEEYENQPLILTSHGRTLEIGSFLSNDEKHEFSGVLRDALKIN
jgi:uncharacterized membrane protein